VDPREEIERAARHQRSAHSPETTAKQERRARQDVLDESLTGASAGNVVILALGIPLIMVVTSVFFVVLPLAMHSGWPVLLGLPGTVGAMFGVGWVLTRWQSGLQAGAVRRIGHGFDAQAYIEQLAEKRRSGRLVATVRFDDAWDAELKRSTADAIRTWCPEVKEPRWDGDRVLHLDTDNTSLIGHYRKGKYGYTTKFTNNPLHRVLRTLQKRVLPRLHAVHPIARFDAKIEGHVCPILEKP
jgi:hypothetical protein